MPERPPVTQKEKVLLKIRQASDLPAMAETVNIINKFKASEDTSVSDLASILLKDYALTTKILKVVNSVHYMQSGQVTTISRAIFLMGIDSIKNIAMTLMLYDQLQKRSSRTEIMDTIIQAFCGGVLARQIVQDLNYAEEEEAFICALLHPLGKIIVAHTMPEKISEIRNASAEKGITEEQASMSVLGITYEEIGTTIATEWNYPQKIVQSMHHTTGADASREGGEGRKLAIVASLATDISGVLAADGDKNEKEQKIGTLLSAYHDSIPANRGRINNLITTSIQNFNSLATVLELDLEKTQFSNQLKQWTEEESPVSDKEVLSFQTDSLRTIDTLFMNEVENAETIFSKGVQDINNSMLGSYALNDVIHIALETIYRGMQTAQVSRVLFFVKNIKQPQMEIRFGFGGSVTEAKKWFVIEVGGEADIFNIALSRDTDVVVKDATSPEIRKFIPAWYKSNTKNAGYLILSPVSINKKNIGLISIEGESRGFAGISRSSLTYLKILRDQIVIATKQTLRYDDKPR